MPDTTVIAVTGRRIWAPDGASAVEVDIQLACGSRGRAMASSNDRSATPAAIAGAVATTNGLIAAALHAVDACRQADIDSTLFKLDGAGARTALGRSLTAACSLAAARAAARARRVPLYRHLRAASSMRLPTPVITIWQSSIGATARGTMCELAVVPFSAQSLEEALATGQEIETACDALFPRARDDEQRLLLALDAIGELGYLAGEEVGLAVRLSAPLDTPATWTTRLANWMQRYPLALIEDPCADIAATAAFTRATGSRARILASASLGSDAERIGAAAADRACSGVTLDLAEAGTLSELRVAFDAACRAGWTTLLAADSQRCPGSALAHLAAAWEFSYVKVGRCGRGLHTEVWNELLRIEAAMRPQPVGISLESAARLVH